MKSSLIIRRFRLSDYDAVLRVWDGAKLPYRPAGRDSLRRIEKELKLGRSVFLVAESDGRVVGTVLGTHDGRKGRVNRLAVLTEYRRAGVAHRLVAEVEKRFAGLGLEVIACLVEGHNRDAMKVFARLGYEKSDVVYFSRRRRPDA